MIVADTSSLITLGLSETLEIFLEEFDVHTTEEVIKELEETSGYNDSAGKSAEKVLNNEGKLKAHKIELKEFESSRVDSGEASCLILSNKIDADFLLTDDLRAIPELKAVSDAKVAISPIVLKALVKRSVLTEQEAVERLEYAAKNRDWLESEIYHNAQELFQQKN